MMKKSEAKMPIRIASNYKHRPTYLKEWREYRRLSQAQALKALKYKGVACSKPSLSRLENGRQPYSEPILLALADLYQCEPADLISRRPAEK
jgi:transcriptional regulator with XRE-family HTH domain